MRILVTSLFFHPDHSGIALYSSDFALYAAEKGHDVTVITGFPFYPNWKKRLGDRRRLFRTERRNGIVIKRGYLYVPSKPTTFKRIIQEFTFILFVAINFLRTGKQDVVVAFTTPISLGFVSGLLKRLFKHRLVINVQDLQLDAAASLEMVRTGAVTRVLSSLEKRSYDQSDLVASISQGMLDVVREKGVDAEKLYYWPNWIDVESVRVRGEYGAFRRRLGLSADKTLIAYAGNIGLKQGLSVLVDLAFAMKDSDNIIFLVIGAGADLQNIKTYAQKRKVQNIVFTPFLDEKVYYDMLTDVDIVFLPQRKVNSDVYFPSKLLAILAKSKVILVSADKASELYKVCEDNQLGMLAQYGDISHMESLVRQCLVDPEVTLRYRLRSRQFVEQFDRRRVLDDALERISLI